MFLSLHLVHQDFSVLILMLRYRDKIAVQFGHQPPGLPHRSTGDFSERLVMIRINFFIHVHCARAATTGSVKALPCRIKCQIIHAFSDGEGLELLARFGIENDDLSAPTSDKQAMIDFIESNRPSRVTEGQGPTGKEPTSIAVDYIDLVL